jgi:hypothetical protein
MADLKKNEELVIITKTYDLILSGHSERSSAGICDQACVRFEEA